MKPFSTDLRERVLADYEGGMTFAELGRKYTVSAEWVRQFIRRYEATGEIEPRPPIPKVVPFYRRYESELRAAVAEQPDLTLEGLRTMLKVNVSIATLHNALKVLKISFKKNACCRGAGPPRCCRREERTRSGPEDRPRPGSLRFHRRNLDQNKHDAGLR